MMRPFRLLLWLYPASFRNEYGEEMARLFDEQRRGAGAGTRLALWRDAVRDAVVTAPGLHLDLLRQDLRYSVRSLGRTPGFTGAALLVMALGIGATTAVFSVADRTMLRPLPFHDPDRLVRVWEHAPGYPQLEPSPANWRDWQAMSRSFESLEAHMTYSMNMLRGEPRRVEGIALSAGLLPLLGVQPALGRLFNPEETTLGGPDVAILSDRLWRGAFGADPSVVGQAVRLDDTTYTIVGVMPPAFYFPDRETELWIPMTLGPSWFEDRDNNSLRLLGRLRDGITLEAARNEMNAVTAALERAHPKENAQTRATVRLFADQVSWQSRLLIRVLTGASVCLLLIACTNLATLLLARFMGRRRELTVRAALGAGRERLTRQLLTESLVLSLAGGGAGVVLAVVTTPLLVRLVPTSLPVPDATALDPRVLVFAAGVTIATGLLFGVLPAWRTSRAAQQMSLREGARGAAPGRDRVRAGLVAVQIAASVLLLVSTGLFIRALERVQAIDPGFETEGVLTLRTALPFERYATTAARSRLYERVLDDVRALPGVTGSAYTSFTPMVMRGGIWKVEAPGIQGGTDDPHTASLRYLTSGYFGTLGIPLLEGRDLSTTDTMETPKVAVVSRSFASRYFPNGALGGRFTIAFHERTIVGIAADVRVRGLEAASEPQVYLPYRQINDGWMPFYAPKDLLVRTAGDPLSLTSTIRNIIRRADPELPVSDVRTMGEVVAQETASRRTQSAVLALFAGIAVILAGVGLHGLLAFGVAQRRQEIGIRTALGAPRTAIVRLVATESAALLVLGGAAGIALAYLAGRTFQSLLASVSPSDPVSYGTALGVSILVVASGTLLPVRRALRVDPLTAIRAE